MNAFVKQLKNGRLGRSVTALLLAAVLMLSAISGTLVLGATDVKIWDGRAQKPTVGDGTEDTPYEISLPEHLAWAVTSGETNKYFILTDDIYLNDVTESDWYTRAGLNEWYNGKTFLGHINGDGHIVYGIWYPEGNAYESVGLFPRFQSGSITKLGIRRSRILGSSFAGGFIGFATSSLTMDQCFVDETVSVYQSGSSGSYGAGGLIGNAENCKASDTSAEVRLRISNSFSTASVSGNGGKKYRINGIIGQHYKSATVIENCYSVGVPPYYMGDASSMTYAYSKAQDAAMEDVLSNVYSDTAPVLTGSETYSDYYTEIAATSMIGEKAEAAMDGFDFTDIFETVEGRTPKLRAFNYEPEETPGTSDPEGTVWNGSVTPPVNGQGTAEAPFEISAPSQLAWAIANGTGSASGKYFVLTADLYLNDVTESDWYTRDGLNAWYGDTEFNGHIDGGGHVVYGIWYPDDTGYTHAALIPKMKSGSVKNLGVSHARIYAQLIAGGILGEALPGFLKTVDRCFVDSSVEIRELSPTKVGSTNYSAGGIVSCINSDRNSNALTEVRLSITNCYSTASVSGAGSEVKRFNGILGDNWASATVIKNCYSYGISPYFAATPSNQSSISSSKYGNSPEETLADNYTDVANPTADYDCPTEDEHYTVLASSAMFGSAAEASMTGLDFGTVFETVEGATPKLRVFADYQPDMEEPEEVEPPVTPDPGGDDGEIWDGSTAASFAKGSGSASDPYLITKGSELKRALTTANKDLYYRLANDIYLNDVEKDRWFADSTNNRWISDTAFAGTLDGDGHIVYGIWYPQGNAGQSAGLVAVLQTGTVKNIGVRYAQIYAQQYVGGIVGRTPAGGYKVIESCFIDESVTVGYTGSGNSTGAGGMLGYAENDRGTDTDTVRVAISNCYSKATIEGESASRINGIVGNLWKVAITVKNCYSVYVQPYYMRSQGTVSANFWNYDGGVGYTEGAAGAKDINEVLANVYTDTAYMETAPSAAENYRIFKRAEMVGENARTSMSGLDFDNVFEIVADGTPKLKIFTSLSGADVDMSADGQTFSGGNGSEENPYVIETADQLRYLVESKSTEGKYYVLANDIYVNDTTVDGWMNGNPAEWYDRTNSIVFSGHLDGRGYSVYGLYVNNEPTVSDTMKEQGAALFPVANTLAEIRNVHIRDSYISGTGYVGSIIGRLQTYNTETFAKVIGCSADGSVVLQGQTVGGLVGGGNRGLELQYSYFTGTLTATSSGRGNALIGDVWSTAQRVAQCYSIGYQNFRSGSATTPGAVLVLYGTVEQTKTTVVEKSMMYGAAAKTAMPKLDWDIWYTVDGSTPHLRVIETEDLIEFNAEGTVGKVWSGLVATKFAGGTGAENDPYLIETPEQLAYMINQTGSSKGTYYRITADLKLNDTTLPDWTAQAIEWVSSNGEWGGNLDGGGHVISGLYFNATDAVVGLFQKIVTGACIQKLGITQSSITSTGSNSYAAAFVGQTIGNNATDDKDTYVRPIISQCFADDSVYIEARYAGGLVAGNPRALAIDNSYFSGELSGESYAGTLIANTWNGYSSIIKNCYSVSLDRDPFMQNSGAANAEVIASYIDGSRGKVNGVTSLGIVYMTGELAKENMTGFDFENIWMTVEDGTPVLRCFENAAQYSSHRDPYLLELSFASEGGSACESLYGFAGQPLDLADLPVPVRRGYNFDGWFTSVYKILPFTTPYFPDYEMVLYAKWTQVGFEEGFEGVLDETYDYNSLIEHFKPGLTNYRPQYVHSGMKSLHILTGGNDSVRPTFLLSYKNPLTVGREYDVIFYICGVQDGSSGTVEFLTATDPHVYSKYGVITAVEYTGLKGGEWRECHVRFVANAPYVLIRTTSDSELYYDDFSVVSVGTGEVPPLELQDGMGTIVTTTVVRPSYENAGETVDGDQGSDGGTTTKKKVVVKKRAKKASQGEEAESSLMWVIIVAAAAVVLAGAATATVMIVRKKRKQQQ